MPHLHTNDIPRNYVPGNGQVPADVMFIGEAPGQQENATGIPFVGQAGEEKNRYLRSAGLERGKVFITNLSKVWPLVDFRGKQLPPTAEQIALYADDLRMEIELVNPRIIGAVGAHAARALIPDFGRMRDEHGIPRIINLYGRERAVVAVIHPAAGLHTGSQEEMARIQFDYQQIGRLLRGQIPFAEPVDQYPHPRYLIVNDTDRYTTCCRSRIGYEGCGCFDLGGGRRQLSGPEFLSYVLAGSTLLGVDTEGTIADPECVTVCVRAGEGYLIHSSSHETLMALHRHINAPRAICTVACHYLSHDLPVLAAMNVDIDRRQAFNSDGSLTLRCTMGEAHLLGGIEPKGMKALQWRIAGMENEEYEEVTGETEYANARSYLERVFTSALCEACAGTGKAREKYKVIDPACADCSGSGRVAGKRANTTKACDCVKTKDKCLEPGCVDGLYIAAPDREFVFDADKAEFRWKQPQSAAKWLRRQLSKQSILDSEDDEGDEAAGAAGADDDEDDNNYFKLRRSFYASPIAEVVTRKFGHIPRTRLFDVPDINRVRDYACKDADGVVRIAAPLESKLAHYKLLRAREIDARMIPGLSSMEQAGMHIDRAHFESFAADLEKEMGEIREKLSLIVDAKVNPNSPKLADVLFRQLGLPTIKLTKSGARESIDDEVLSTLRNHLKKRLDSPEAVIGLEVIQCITDYRERLKALTGHVLPILEKADADDRIHTTIKYTQAMTRLSSKDPNLQNIANPDNSPWGNDPIRNIGLRMRNGFDAPPGYKLISCDYSQIELVVGAHLTQDRNLLEVFRSGLDLHYYVASHLLQIPYAEVPKPIRTQMKPLNFGAFYDLSAMGLQAQFAQMNPPVEKSELECEELLRWYFAEFAPGVQAWKQKVRQQARIDGYVTTMFGRLRWMTGLRSDLKRVRSAAERECTNAPVQGTAGDILRIAIGELHEDTFPALWAEGIDARMINTVHDEIIIESPEEHAELVGEVVRQKMQSVVQLSVPVKVGVGIGNRWGELK